jgi:acyl-CoA hydrolase
MVRENYVSAEEAVKKIKSGDRVFMHGSAATPVPLIKAMQARHEELQKVELVSVSTLGDVNFDDPLYRRSFFFNSLFVSANARKVVNSDDGDYVPVFLSQIPQLFRKYILPINVALVHVSPPDQHGFCTLGTSVDIALSAVQTAKYVIAMVNPRMPRTHGDGFIHVDRIDALVWHEMELPEVDYSAKTSESIERIGKNVASLIDHSFDSKRCDQ